MGLRVWKLISYRRKRMAAIFHYVDVYDISEYMVCLDIYLSLVLQLRLSVVQHQVFLIGNPTSSIEKLLEESCTSLPLLGIWPKLHLIYIVQILLRVELFCRLQQWRLDLGHLIAYFQWRMLPFHWEDSKEGPCAYFHILASDQPFIYPYSAFYFQIYVISVGGVTGWFGTPFGELVFQ